MPLPVVIPHTFGEGGAHLTSGDSSGRPSLKEILEDLATGVNAANNLPGAGNAAITAGPLDPFSNPPTPAQLEALRTLVNQIRAALVAQ